MRAVEAALIANPTPGVDFPADKDGARNDVGALWYFDAPNDVRSFRVEIGNSVRTDAVVNYTYQNHTLDEGFVVRYAYLRKDGRIVLVNYGEGNALKQNGHPNWRRFWEREARSAWRQNSGQIFRAAIRYLEQQRRQQGAAGRF